MSGLGITVDGQVVRIVDGDTIEVEVKKVLRIRLIDCWAPELRQQGGDQARRFMTSIAMGQDVFVSIPMEEQQKFGDSMSFGRILGHVTLKSGMNLATEMVRNGHAKGEKP